MNKVVELLKNNFPELVRGHEGTYEVDIEKLKLELGKGSDIINEGYSLNWLGQSYSRVLRDCPATTLIKPDNNHNQLPENINSNNVYIEGDNLEVLKHLKNAYTSKIKMIYIDPPYNTGSDGFVYNDSFNFDVETFMRLSGLDKEEAEKVLNYTKSKRNSHSAWLTFMYPRLYIARELLKDDGVIFISIDDNEQAQLKLLCDQIFGEENFVFDIPRITKKGGKTSSLLMQNHDHLLCYSKAIEKVSFAKLEYNEQNLKKFKYEDDKGLYALTQTLDYNSLKYSRNMDYEIKVGENTYYPGGYDLFCQRQNGKVNENDWVWRWSKERVQKALELDLIVEKNGRLYTKQYLNLEIEGKKEDIQLKEVSQGQALSSLTFIDNSYSNDNAKKEFVSLMGDAFFSYTKPTKLITTLINICIRNNTDEIVLDFFSGSSTTADAVMQLNGEDNGNRKFIMVQLPEKIENEKISDFCTKELKQEPIIPTIAKERVKRAAKKIKEEKKDKEYIDDLDLGFKVYKTIKDDRTDVSQLVLFDVKDGIKTDVDDLDALLTTWMLHDGYDLNSKVYEIMINKYKGYRIKQTLYLLDKGFSTEDLLSLVEKLNDPNTPLINQIILNSSNFGNKVLQEFHENVFSKNSKEAKIVVEDR